MKNRHHSLHVALQALQLCLGTLWAASFPRIEDHNWNGKAARMEQALRIACKPQSQTPGVSPGSGWFVLACTLTSATEAADA